MFDIVVPYGSCIEVLDIPEWAARNLHGVVYFSSGNIAIAKAASQTYPGANIWPNIAQNAQGSYRNAQFVVDGSFWVGQSIALSSSGPVHLNKSVVSQGETVTVTPSSGTAIGNYTITATRPDGCVAVLNGKVFKFEFVGTKTSDYAPAGTVNPGAGNPVYDGPNARTSISGLIAVGLGGGTAAADVSHNFDVKIQTNPAGAFTGSVTAALHGQTSYNTTIHLIKYSGDNGATFGVSVRVPLVPWLSISISGTGNKHVASGACGFGLSFGGESASYPTLTQRSTVEFDVPFFATNDERNWSGSISVDKLDSQMSYQVGSTSRAFRIHSGVIAHSTSTFSQLWPAISTGVIEAVTDGTNSTVILYEENNEYEIQ